MVAIVKSGYSIKRTFYYNENKVKEGVAELIHVQNYPMDMHTMHENHRLNMLLKLASRNELVKRNSIHISLNFAPGEKIEMENLKEIADEYMSAIGFGNQPYLVYQHHDSGHPHIHIVTVKVDHQGKRIETQNIGKTLSEKARKEIEIKYGLVQAEKHKRAVFNLKPLGTEKAIYGERATKQAITTVLNYVLNSYRFTSLPELNAVLNLYNVEADPGSENSRIYKNKGLQYRIINVLGQPKGIAVKASLLYDNPGLKFLQKRFLINHTLREKGKVRAQSEVDMAFAVLGRPTLKMLSSSLRKVGIHVVPRLNKDGLLYGVTYVDHKTKCIFNGSDLGKKYSANAIRNRCTPKPDPASQHHKLSNNFKLIPGNSLNHPGILVNLLPFCFKPQNLNASALIQSLLQPEFTTNYLPPELRKKRKKKRKNNQINPNT